MEQIYYSEASEKGGYDVVRRNDKGFLVPMEKEHYLTEQEAKKRAHELNEDFYAEQQLWKDSGGM